MAVYGDVVKIKQAMADAYNFPNQCRWVKHIQITYSMVKGLWLAEFDCDMNILFDDVTYLSNSVYFRLNGRDVAFITHKGLSDSACD